MKKKLSTISMTVAVAALLSVACGVAFANDGKPMKPELAAKKEMVRKQHEQRITHDKRKTAAEALKAERLKIYQAKQEAKQSNPDTTNK